MNRVGQGEGAGAQDNALQHNIIVETPDPDSVLTGIDIRECRLQQTHVVFNGLVPIALFLKGRRSRSGQEAVNQSLHGTVIDRNTYAKGPPPGRIERRDQQKLNRQITRLQSIEIVLQAYCVLLSRRSLPLRKCRDGSRRAAQIGDDSPLQSSTTQPSGITFAASLRTPCCFYGRG